MPEWLETPKQVDDAIKGGGRVVILFTAPSWCQPCRAFEPHYERAAANATEISFYRVDIDKAPWALLEYGIKGVPKVLLYEHGTFVRDVKAPQGAMPFITDVRS